MNKSILLKKVHLDVRFHRDSPWSQVQSQQWEARAENWAIITTSSNTKHRWKGLSWSHRLSKTVPCNFSPPARLPTVNILQLPQTVPPTRNQVFKCVNLWETLLIQTITFSKNYIISSLSNTVTRYGGLNVNSVRGSKRMLDKAAKCLSSLC